MVWEGGKVGDVELTLGVGDDDGGTKEAGVTVADAGGAGSTALMLQSVLPLYTLGGRVRRRRGRAKQDVYAEWGVDDKEGMMRRGGEGRSEAKRMS